MSFQTSETQGPAVTIIGTLAFLVSFGMTACGLVQAPGPTAAPRTVSTPTVTPTPNLLVVKNTLGGFPFPPGTTWVYSHVEYAGVAGDPTAIITATKLVTETVVPVNGIAPSVSFQIKRIAALVSAPPDLPDPMLISDSVYRIEGNQIYSVSGDPGQIRTLVYDFPFVVGKSWCPEQPPPVGNPTCHANGLRYVEDQLAYATPVGIFDECYDISEEYNSGGVRECFCSGIGVVARKYDHSGSPFGFEDKLINFSRSFPPGTGP